MTQHPHYPYHNPQPGDPGIRPSFSAPPTVAGRIARPQERSKWPGVLGMLAAIMGGLGILYCLWNGATPLIMPMFERAVGPQASMQMGFAAVQKYNGAMVGLYAVGVVLAALLLWGGLGLNSRRRSGPGRIVLWSWLKIVWAVGAGVLMYFIQRDQFAAMASDPNLKGAAGFMGSFAMIGAAMVFFFHLALPAFFLIWFSRPPIKQEIAGWTS